MKTKKMLSFFLCFAMMLGVMPCTAAAEGVEQLYLYWDIDDYRTAVSHTAGGKDFLLVFTIAEDEVTTDGSYTYGCTEALGAVEWDGDTESVIWFPADKPAVGQITATKNGVTYAIDAVLEEGDPEEIITEIGGSHLTTEADVCADTDWLEAQAGSNSATAAFTLDGETYYMSVGQHDDDFPYSGHGMSFSLEEEPCVLRYFDIGFYAALPGGAEFARIKDPETVAKIEQAFEGSLKLTVQGLNFNTHTAPQVFPAMHQALGDALCCNCIALELGAENWGSYVLTGSGTVGEQELFVQVTFRWNPRGEIVFEPTDDDPIGQINAYLEGLNPEAKVNLTINMPKGEYQGYITVPEELFNPEIVIFGAIDENDDLATVIRGGVRTDGAIVNVMDMIFLGAGSDQTGDPPESWGDGTPNIALLGNGFIRSNWCRYEGYDIAMCGDEVLKFGLNNTFVHNNIAVLLDTEADEHAITSLEGSRFSNNGIAVAFCKVPANFALSAVKMARCRFVDNDLDILNELKRNIFLPGCYFAKTTGGEEVVRECQYSPPAVGNERKQVLYYPQAATADFEKFLYDTRLYHHKPVVSVDFTKIFPIPVGALDGAEFTVMKGDTELARITYEAEEEGQSLSLLGGSDETFDATVQVERTDDCIEITLQAIPADTAPVISVPCDAGWTAVAVTNPEGEPLAGTVANGYASFVARTGGTYVIEKVIPALQYRIDSLALLSETGEPLAELPAGKCSVKVSVTNVASAGDVLVMAGLYTADGQYLGLVSQPVENLVLNDSREVTLPVDNTDNKIADLTVFVVTSLADPVPLGDSKPLLP